jgi:hypothetical protein
MNIIIVKNKYLNALLLLMLFSATVHMIILFCLAILRGDLYLLNYFNILSISYIIPNFLHSFWGNIASFAVTAILYFIILKFNSLESKE